MRLRSFPVLVAAPLLVTLGYSPAARADVLLDALASGPPNECSDAGAAGTKCDNAGKSENEKGVCVSVKCPGTHADECDGFTGTYLLCEVPTGKCGDGACDDGETCATCSEDCGSCGPDEAGSRPPMDSGSSCGNGSCDDGETCSTCPADCGNCPGKDAAATDSATDAAKDDSGSTQLNGSGGCSTTPAGVGDGGSAWFFFGLGATGLIASSVSRRRRRS
jgi:hypothetical protein